MKTQDVLTYLSAAPGKDDEMLIQREVLSELKRHRYIDQPDVSRANTALDIKKHEINDPVKRRDKVVKVDADENEGSAQKVIEVDGAHTATRIEPVARVALALQRLIVNHSVSFLFGNPVIYNATPENDNQKMVMKALNRILYDVKSTSLNRRAARAMFGYKEVAEYWYTVETDKVHTTYGFPTKFKLRCALFSPAFGDTLYPYFDETGDMVAFSREFTRKEGDAAVSYFETWTAEAHWLWRNGTLGYEVVEGYPTENPIGKIPVVFGCQDYYETEMVDKLIDRLEKLLSNFADTNDYHASPKIFVTGQVTGFARKGESGAIIEGEENATAQYLSWQNAPESVRLEIETLLRMIHKITQTPDISWDSVKGLNVSGVALKLLFMDAHLKVQDKREVFDEYLQRRVNIIKAFIAQFNTGIADDAEATEVEPEVVPYIITSDIDDLQYWMTANGNLPVISQEESVERAGLSRDVESTMTKLKEQDEAANAFSIAEPVMDA